MKLIFVRHPETEFNKKNIAEGQNNSSYTEVGHYQFMELIKALIEDNSFQIIVSSPLKRALNVAKVVANALAKPLVVYEALMERHFGDWQGTVPDQKIKESPYYKDNNWAPPGGETRNQHSHRVIRLITEFKSYFFEKTILVSTHAGTIVRAWEYFQLPYFKPSNASISEIEIVNGAARLIRQNGISHLKGGEI